MRRLDVLTPALFSAFLVAGCGGGSGGAPAAPAAKPVSGSPNGSGSALALRISVPQTGSSSQRRPAFVSSSTQSLVATVTSGTTQVGIGFVNFTASSPSCTSSGSSLTCTLTVPLTISAQATYMLTVATYDQTQTTQCAPAGTPACAGNVLSQNTVAQPLQPNTVNQMSLTLGGIAASFSVTPSTPGYLQGNVAGLKLWGSSSQSLTLQALDADGNVIIGSGAPTLGLTTTGSTVTVFGGSGGFFTLQPATGGSPAVVTPGSVTLTATATFSTATPPPSLPSSTVRSAKSSGNLTASIPLTILHSIVALGDGTQVYLFYDGNTTPTLTITSANVSGPRGLAFDANQTLYVSNHSNNEVTEYPLGSTSASVSISSGVGGVEGVVIDKSGNIWIANSNISLGNITEYLVGSTSSSSPNIVITDNAQSQIRGVTFDPSGNLIAVDQSTGTADLFNPPFSSSSTPSATFTSDFNAPIGAAFDASGNLWVVNAGSSNVQEFTPPFSAASSPAATITGMNSPNAAAFDAAGTLWVSDGASGSNGGVWECFPPLNSATTCTKFANLAAGLWIAVSPRAIVP